MRVYIPMKKRMSSGVGVGRRAKRNLRADGSGALVRMGFEGAPELPASDGSSAKLSDSSPPLRSPNVFVVV